MQAKVSSATRSSDNCLSVSLASHSVHLRQNLDVRVAALVVVRVLCNEAGQGPVEVEVRASRSRTVRELAHLHASDALAPLPAARWPQRSTHNASSTTQHIRAVAEWHCGCSLRAGSLVRTTRLRSVRCTLCAVPVGRGVGDSDWPPLLGAWRMERCVT